MSKTIRDLDEWRMAPQKAANPVVPADDEVRISDRRSGSSGDLATYSPELKTQAQSRTTGQLDLFAARCNQMAERIRAGEVPFVFGVDVLYDASIWSGLSDRFGDDVCQRIMADAFLGSAPA